MTVRERKGFIIWKTQRRVSEELSMFCLLLDIGDSYTGIHFVKLYCVVHFSNV